MTDTSQRVFGRHEAEAMFEAIVNALRALGAPGRLSEAFLRELQAERSMLVDERTQVHLALLRDYVTDPGKAVENALLVLEKSGQ